jgi:hypothetical protein
MIATMPASIFFSGGATVTVTAEAEDVRNRLAEAKQDCEAFAHFQAQGSGDVYVAADLVAYVQQIGSTA